MRVLLYSLSNIIFFSQCGYFCLTVAMIFSLCKNRAVIHCCPLFYVFTVYLEFHRSLALAFIVKQRRFFHLLLLNILFRKQNRNYFLCTSVIKYHVDCHIALQCGKFLIFLSSLKKQNMFTSLMQQIQIFLNDQTMGASFSICCLC